MKNPTSHYKVIDHGVTYPASLHPVDVGWRLKFGQGHCVMFTIYYPRHGRVRRQDRQAVMEEFTTAYLEGITYRATCTTDGDMEKGTGTVNMLWSAIKLLKVLFPAVKSTTLKDTSRTSCALGTSISLLHSYLARHSATWYQVHFGAKPCDPNVLVDLAKGAAKMASRPPPDSFDDFFEKEVVVVGYRVRVHDFKEVLRKRYIGDEGEGISPAESYTEFFQRLNDRDCILLESWISRFIEKEFGSAARGDLYWQIDFPDDLILRSIPAFKVTLVSTQEIQFGGLSEEPSSSSTWRPMKHFSELQFLDFPVTMR